MQNKSIKLKKTKVFTSKKVNKIGNSLSRLTNIGEKSWDNKKKWERKRKHKSPAYKNKAGGFITHLANIITKKLINKEIRPTGNIVINSTT